MIIDCFEINSFLVKLEKPHICRSKKDPKSAFCKKCLCIHWKFGLSKSSPMTIYSIWPRYHFPFVNFFSVFRQKKCYPLVPSHWSFLFRYFLCCSDTISYTCQRFFAKMIQPESSFWNRIRPQNSHSSGCILCENLNYKKSTWNCGFCFEGQYLFETIFTDIMMAGHDV